jgi:putative Mg2+ transporter-C (MgtC) family protein
MHHILSGLNLEILKRIVIAILLGSLIGIERELTNKWAGLRTHILVCLGSAIFTILSIYGFPIVLYGQPIKSFDPSRIAAQILTGIGFIGGGTVLRHGPTVHGLTTAATLWMSASIGMAIGAGKYEIAIAATLLSVIVLVVVGYMEKKLIPGHNKSQMFLKIVVTCKDSFSQGVMENLYILFPSVLELSEKYMTREEGVKKITFKILTGGKSAVNTTFTKINSIQNVDTIDIRQVYDV